MHEGHSRRLSLRSLPRISDKVRFIQHGLSRAVSNRPICIQSLPRRQLARLPTKMSCYSSTLSHIHIYTYTTTYELARLLIVQSLLLYAYGISYCNTLDVPNIWALAWYVDSGRSLVIHSLSVDLCFFLRGMVRRYSGDRQRMPALRRSRRSDSGLKQFGNCSETVSIRKLPDRASPIVDYRTLRETVLLGCR